MAERNKQLRRLLDNCRCLCVHCAGAGDSLRLIHALRTKIILGQLHPPVAIVTTKDGLQECYGLFNPDTVAEPQRLGGTLVARDGQAVWIAPAEDRTMSQLKPLTRVERLIRQLSRSLNKWKPAEPVLHVYLGENNWPPRSASFKVGAQRIKRKRIDNTQLMSIRRWEPPIPKKTSLSKQLRALYIIREHADYQRERNTPLQHVERICGIAQEKNFELAFGGLQRRSDYQKYPVGTYECVPYDDFESGRYLPRIRKYGEYDLALGVNSGPLDVALAAGLPGLRDFEFFGLPKQPFKKQHNWFLATALNVGLAPATPTSSLESSAHLNRFDSSLRELIDLIRRKPEEVLAPRHVILPWPKVFTADNYTSLFEAREVVQSRIGGRVDCV